MGKVNWKKVGDTTWKVIKVGAKIIVILTNTNDKNKQPK